MVSVIIPTYNSEEYLRESIESIFNQTFKDYEIILVDDGSTDNTREIVKQFYPSVKYIYQDQGGAARARNTGIRAARGEFIAFLDADDIWLPTKLEKQVEHFRQHTDVGFIFTEHSQFNENGIIRSFVGKRDRLVKGEILENIFLYSGVATPTVIVRKKVFEQVGLFDEDLIAAEDDNMWLRIAYKFGIDFIDEPLVMVRINDRSITSDPMNIIKGVGTHLFVLERKYPELAKRLGTLINKKRSSLFRSLGYYYFSRNEFKRSRAEFRKSLQHWRFNLFSICYLLLSFLPVELIGLMKFLKIKSGVNFFKPHWLSASVEKDRGRKENIK